MKNPRTRKILLTCYFLILSACGGPNAEDPPAARTPGQVTEPTEGETGVPSESALEENPEKSHNGTCHDREQVRVGGRVTNSRTRAAVRGATVRYSRALVCGINQSVTTDSAGRYTISNLPLGTYDVQITAAGCLATNTSTTLYSDRSQNRDFTIIPNTQPTTTITIPTGGARWNATNSPITIGGECNDPDLNLTRIDLRNMTNGYFASKTLFYQSNSTYPFSFSNVTLATGENTITVSCVDSFDTREMDSINVSLSSNRPPNDCTLTSPSNGATGVPLGVTLDWTCSDPDAGDRIVDYNLQLDNNSDFSSPLKDGRTGSSTSTWQPQAGGITLGYNTAYYWRVYGIDTAGAISRFWIPWSFTTAAPPGDRFELDNSSGQAKQQAVNTRSDAHSIVPANDVDWIYFVLSRTSDVTIETSGSSGDTRMWLYNSALSELGANDDIGGGNYFSRITASGLLTGTYYVKVDEFQNNHEIPAYYITLSVTAPNSPPSVSFWSPTNGSNIDASPVALDVACVDTNGNLDTGTVRNETTGWDRTYAISGDFMRLPAVVPLTPGFNTISVTCRDSAGASSPPGSISINYDVCSNGTAKDSYNDACIHDEDGDGIHDDSDECPGIPNDSFNSACDPNDNYDFKLDGSDINITLIQGTTDQTRQFTITNRGSVNLVYSFTTSASAPWLNLVKNGGNGGALNQTHTLAGGQVDRFTASLNATDLAPGTTVTTTLLVTSNDISGGSDQIPISLTSEQAPYCSVATMCVAPPSQFLGNQSPVTQTVSDPVSTATGNYAYHHEDLTLPVSRGFDLIFARTYNAQDQYLGPLGFGWTHAYNIFVTNFQDGTIHVKWPDGHTEIFTENVDGTYQSPTGVFSTLTDSDAGGFELTTKGKTVFRFAATSGRLTEVEDRKGNKLTLTYDDKGRLEKTEGLTGNYLTFQYEGTDPLKISSVTDKTNRRASFGYTNDDLTRFTDARGNAYQYTYDNQHRLTEITDPLNQRLVHNTYDAHARVTEQRDGLNHLTTLDYDPTQIGRVTVTDPLNQTLTQVYDNQFRITESGDPAGNTMAYQYNNDNLRTRVTDRENVSANANYDANGNMLSITDAMGQVTSFTYNENHEATKIVLPNGHERNFEYDAEGNLTRVWETLDGTTIETAYRYNAWGQPTSIIDSNNNTTTYGYDVAGNLESITRPDHSVVQFTYDSANRLSTITNPLNAITRFEYNTDNQLTKVVDPDNLETRYEYDANGNPTKVIDRKRNETQLRYNANQFLEVIRDALGNETAIVYDSLNRRSQITDPENRATRFTYDAAGFLTQITDPSGKIFQFQYDKEGNLTSKRDSAGQTWTYGYNDRGQPILMTDPLGNTTQYTYDVVTGLLTQATDVEGNATQFVYDAVGRLTTTTDPLGQTTSFAYNKLGNLIRLTNAAGNTTTFTYDALGRKTGQTNALNESEEYFYNLAGRLRKTIDAKQQETNFNYDNLGRLTSIVFADNSTTSFTYDENGNQRSMANAAGTVSYTHNELNRLTGLTDVHGFQLQYRYDKTGLLTRLTYPENKTVQYEYNPSKQLTSVTDWLGYITRYSYDPAGRLSAVTLPNSFTTTYSYDTASRLTGLHNKKADGSTLTRYDMTLDEIGNRTEIVREGELTPWLLPENTGATFNLENALLTYGGLNLGYDANGNLITLAAGADTTTYQWDALDQLTNIRQPDGDAFAFTYDGSGSRVQKTSGGATTQLLVDSNRPLPDVLAEANSEGAIQKYYIYGLGLLAQANADGSEIHYYHYDPIGSTAALSNGAGEVTDQYLYDEFGQLNRRTGDTSNPFQYVGQFGVQNDDTGLYFMRARYYDPQAGRFVSRDPIGLVGGMNLYGYSNQNPVNFVDPSGLSHNNTCHPEPSLYETCLSILEQNVIGPLDSALMLGKVASDYAAYRRFGLEGQLFPFDIGTGPIPNPSGNLRGVVKSAPAARTSEVLGLASRYVLVADLLLTTAGELPRAAQSAIDIHNDPGMSPEMKVIGFGIVEPTLTLSRIGSKMIIGTGSGLVSLAQMTRGQGLLRGGVDPLGTTQWLTDLASDSITGQPHFVDTQLENISQWFDDREKDIEWWTAMNVRGAVQDMLYGNPDLSGGVPKGAK